MRVLVAGASGVVGHYLVPMLVSNGHEVVGTATRPERLAEIARLGATPLRVDGLDPEAVKQAVAETRPEAIINEMTALAGKPDFKHFDRWFATTNALRTTGTANLLEAAKLTRTTTRFVVQSYAGWTSAASGGGPVTEDEPFDPHPLPGQRETLDAIKRMEKLVTDAPMDGIVLRYANLYAADALEQSIRMLRQRQFPIVGEGDGVWSWLHAADAASATVAALERGQRGIYNAADDDPAPVKAWLPELARLSGAPAPMHVPAWLARLLIGEVGVRMMTRVRGVSNVRIKRELGWQPTYGSWRDGFRAVTSPRPAEEVAHAVG